MASSSASTLNDEESGLKLEEERRVICTVTRLFTSKAGGIEEGEKGEEDTGP